MRTVSSCPSGIARRSRRLLFPLLVLSLVPGLRAQVAAAPEPGKKSEEDEQAIVLAPFEVKTDKDEGYLAQNTASGSRLNTSLRNTPAPISVFTAEFMQDIGATDLASLSEYAINTERIPGFQGGVAAGNNLGEFDAQFRVRGLPTSNNEGRSVNFFKYLIEVDSFNTERVEFARGPNSILFGLGSVAGNFNVSTKKADLRRTRYDATVRTDSNNSLRASVDLNQPLAGGRAAVRINALVDQTNTWRPHEYKDADRLALAARWKITPRTTLDVEFERGLIRQSNQRQWVGADYITDWIAKGRQLDPAAGAPFPAQTTSSVAVLSTANYLVFDTATGTLRDWRNMTTSAATSHSGAAAVPPTEIQLLQDFSLVPMDVVIGGPGVGSNVDYHNYSAFLQHEIVKDLFIEVATNFQDDSYLTRDIFAPQYRIQFDTNAQLPNGLPNPNAGRPYVEGQWGTRERYERVRDHRATLSYDLNLGEKFGRHQMVALAEQRREHTRRTGTGERILNSPFSPANPENAANNVFRRTYVDLTGPSSAIALADFRLQPINGIVNQTTGQPITTFMPANNQNAVYDYSFKYTTFMAATHSTLFKERLIATLGYREDRSDASLSSSVRGAPVGGYTLGFYEAKPGALRDKSKGVTRSQGAVYHVHDKVSLFYNRSSNFALRNPQITVFPGKFAPAPKGKSEDLGTKVSLLQDKLYATITYYQTQSVDENDFVAPGGLSQVNDIWNTLAGAGVITTTERDARLVNANGNTFDSRSQGWEFELVANPTSNWRLSLNYSRNKTVRTRIGSEIIGYIAENRDFFTSGTRGRLVINGNGTLAASAVDAADGVTTITEHLTAADTSIQNTLINPLGARAVGTPTESANLRTNYTFKTGNWLNGIGLGGGVRWRGKPVTGFSSSDPATRQILRGNDSLTLDANVSYRRKLSSFGRKFDWSVQLNVNNVLDEDELLITGSFNDGAPKQYRLQTPRTWMLSSTLRY